MIKTVLIVQDKLTATPIYSFPFFAAAAATRTIYTFWFFHVAAVIYILTPCGPAIRLIQPSGPDWVFTPWTIEQEMGVSKAKLAAIVTS